MRHRYTRLDIEGITQDMKGYVDVIGEWHKAKNYTKQLKQIFKVARENNLGDDWIIQKVMELIQKEKE